MQWGGTCSCLFQAAHFQANPFVNADTLSGVGSWLRVAKRGNHGPQVPPKRGVVAGTLSALCFAPTFPRIEQSRPFNLATRPFELERRLSHRRESNK
jgi:hypothetical protein